MEFEKIYRAYAPKIYRICFGYFNDSEKAKDVTQDTFVTVFENLPTLKHQQNILGWIYRIASNKCLRQLQKERKANLVYDYDFLKIEDIKTGRNESDYSLLQQCISQLPDLDRLIIGLYLEDENQEKIAEIIGITHSNVRVRIHRIKEILSKKMKKNE